MSVISQPNRRLARSLLYGFLVSLLVFGPQPSFADPSKQTLLFPRNAKRVYPKFKAKLKKIATYLKKNSEAILVVTGHTDDTGPERVNRKLSLTRARWVREQLVELGVGEDRITIRGVAHDEPVKRGTSSSARKKNRRVEFEIVLDEAADPTESLADAVPELDEPLVESEEVPIEEATEDVAEVAEEKAEDPSGDEEPPAEGVEERASTEPETTEATTEDATPEEEAPEETLEEEVPEEEAPEEETPLEEEPEPLPPAEEVAPLPALEAPVAEWYTEPLWINTAISTTLLTTSISLAVSASSYQSDAGLETRGTNAWEAAVDSAESRATAAAWMYGLTTVSALVNGWLAYEKYIAEEEILTPYLRFDPSGWFGGVAVSFDEPTEP